MEYNKIFKYAVAGSPVAHSFSPQIMYALSEIFNINIKCTRLSVNNISDLKLLLNSFTFDFLNITYPLKQAILSILTESNDNLFCNTVVKNGNSLYGFNTDIYGALYSINRLINNIGYHQSICVFGAGNSALAIEKAFDSFPCKITFYTAHPDLHAEKFQSNVYSFEHFIKNFTHINFDLYINTLPKNINFFDQYNLSNIQIKAHLLDINYPKSIYSNNFLNIDNGIDWLLSQAVKSFSIFINQNINVEHFLSINREKILANIRHKSPNRPICLIGFSGSGKTEAVAFIKNQKESFDTFDIDSMIEHETGLEISEIFSRFGEEYFRNLESRILSDLLHKRNCLIACGAGIVDRQNNIDLLATKSFNIYLYNDFTNSIQHCINTKRPKFSNLEQLDKLYGIRKNKYFLLSDLIVNSNNNLYDVINSLINEINQI